MNYIFFGTPEFAAIILEKLIKTGFIPAAVVCNPDKPVGRKKIITPPAVKKLLTEKLKDYKIEILQPEKLNNYSITQLLNYHPDLFIVASYAKIIPKEILEIPRLGTIGVHPSLLPKHRGSSPIQTAILKGDEETGTTLYLMDEKIDYGKIVSNIKCQVSSDDNYESLIRKLAELSADLLIKTLPDIEEKIKNAKPQDESQATYTKKFTTEDAYITPDDLEKAEKTGGEIAVQIERKIRALNPEPGVWTYVCENTKLYEITKIEKRVKLLEAKIIEGKLKITLIQIEGKKPQKL